MRKSLLTVTLPIAAVVIFAAAFSARAGDLDPPVGPVAPTMKTLEEVEPRIAINATNTPGDADSLFKIIAPGSYYLTSNITGVSGKHGIEIVASGVTLDLNGFDLLGVAGSLDGVSVTVFDLTNIAVVNGSVRSWGGEGVDLAGGIATSRRVADLLASGNVGHGISTSSASTVTNCVAYNNAANGINASRSCSITGCLAYDNGIDGIGTFGSAFISGCIAYLNAEDGIQCGIFSVVEGNVCSANGAGIHMSSTDGGKCRIEGNHCINSDRGIDVDKSGNYISGNTVCDNTDNYDIVAGNHLNLIISQIPESIDWPATVTLAGDLTGVSGQNGLTINADGVTIDLGGHGLIGVAGSLAGISVPAARKHLTVRNGRVASWGGAGISAANADNSRFEDLFASTNGGGGILTGHGCGVHRVTVETNTGDGLVLKQANARAIRGSMLAVARFA